MPTVLAALPESDVGGQGAWRPLLGDGNGRRLVLSASGVMLGLYLLVLVATAPAAVVLRLAGAPTAWSNAAGTVWAARVSPAPGLTIDWRARPFRSIASFSLVGDVKVEGEGASATARAALRPRRLALTQLSGVVGWPLVQALAPELPFACTFGARLEVARLTIGARSEAAGELRSGAGTCSSREPGGTAASVPPLVTTLAITDGAGVVRIERAGAPGRRFAEARLSPNGRPTFSIFSEGAALLGRESLDGPVVFELGR